MSWDAIKANFEQLWFCLPASWDHANEHNYQFEGASTRSQVEFQSPNQDQLYVIKCYFKWNTLLLYEVQYCSLFNLILLPLPGDGVALSLPVDVVSALVGSDGRAGAGLDWGQSTNDEWRGLSEFYTMIQSLLWTRVGSGNLAHIIYGGSLEVGLQVALAAEGLLAALTLELVRVYVEVVCKDRIIQVLI